MRSTSIVMSYRALMRLMEAPRCRGWKICSTGFNIKFGGTLFTKTHKNPWCNDFWLTPQWRQTKGTVTVERSPLTFDGYSLRLNLRANLSSKSGYCTSAFPLIFWLVVWTPLKNISQLGWLFPIYGKIKNVPNHQPAIDFTRIKKYFWWSHELRDY